jgi:mono/diheme cytochrome c family protein
MRYRRKDIIMFGLVWLILVAGTVRSAMGAGNIAAGEKLYQNRCSPCHGPDGKAATPTAQALNPKPRDHTDVAYMNQLSTEYLTKVIKNGGPAASKSPIMPAHTDLNDQQIEDVITFVRTLAVPPYNGK